jgi:hypothetical protein
MKRTSFTHYTRHSTVRAAALSGEKLPQPDHQWPERQKFATADKI